MTKGGDRKAGSRRTAIWLSLVVLGMLGFGYAMVPLYGVFCHVTGINGKTRLGSVADAKLDPSRSLTVEFVSSVGEGLAWEFRPMQTSMVVHPGEIVEMKYIARNLSNVAVVARAIPSVAPNRAAGHFRNISSFSFSEQVLQPGEKKELPVRFYIDSRVPREVNRVTLSYAFFPLNEGATTAKKAETSPELKQL